MSRKLPTIQPIASWIVQEITQLGQLVRNQRALLGLRIDDAAALCGVSSDVLSRLENGKPVTTNKLMLILNGLGMRLIPIPTRHAIALTPALQAVIHELK
jgi:transcriptional regulator with XRE-family HTH domain